MMLKRFKQNSQNNKSRLYNLMGTICAMSCITIGMVVGICVLRGSQGFEKDIFVGVIILLSGVFSFTFVFTNGIKYFKSLKKAGG